MTFGNWMAKQRDGFTGTQEGGGLLHAFGSAHDTLNGCLLCVGYSDHGCARHYLIDKTDPKTRIARAQLSAQWINRRRTCFGRPNREVDVIILHMCRKAATANPRYMANKQ